jgi:hypothetical protein
MGTGPFLLTIATKFFSNSLQKHGNQAHRAALWTRDIMTNPFENRQPYIDGNPLIRTPQREAYDALRDYAAASDDDEREIGVVLPVGCGKSGCITLTPFAFRAHRAWSLRPEFRSPGNWSLTLIRRTRRCSIKNARSSPVAPIPSPSKYEVR